MNYDSLIHSGVRDLPCVRQFQQVFPDGEHTIVDAKRDFHPDGWGPVKEWISRASLHNRYVVWLVLAIEITKDDRISAIEEPEAYLIEVGKVEKGRDEDGGPLWEYSFGQFEEGGWEELVENGGDFASVGLEMIVDAPVNGFATFWRDTRPIPNTGSPDGIAMRAPLRFSG